MIREEIDNYLKALGKSLRRKYKKSNYQIELVIVGGAAIILNYSFRQSTMDIDAYTDRLTSIKESINEVQAKYNLSEGWLNSDFKTTTSFSENLRQYSRHYKTFGNTLVVYTINEEYLICMKLVAFRTDRHDLDDIIGIIHNSGKEITYSMINDAMIKLYGNWDKVSNEAKEFIEALIRKD